MDKITRKDWKYIFFDADDTLWDNEEHFREAKAKFAEKLSSYADKDDILDRLREKQEINFPVWGYGAKTLLIGMMDTAVEICGGQTAGMLYQEIKKIIHELAYHQFSILDGVEDVLEQLGSRYLLGVATKGDLTEQLTKYRKSGLERFFHHIEVMQNKCAEDYLSLVRKLDVAPQDIIMVGNAIKSDIAPVVEIGGTAIHIPYRLSWEHEMMEMPVSDRIIEIKSIKELPGILL